MRRKGNDMANGNFILKVDNVQMPCPSTFDFGLMDVSAAESGRTDDSVMQKNRVAQKRKIALAWSELTPEETSTVLQAFNPEYISVYYWDAMAGAYQTRNFYVGDRSANVHFWFANNKRFEKVSFDIIER